MSTLINAHSFAAHNKRTVRNKLFTFAVREATTGTVDLVPWFMTFTASRIWLRCCEMRSDEFQCFGFRGYHLPTRCSHSLLCQTADERNAENTFYYQKYVYFPLKTHSTFCDNIKFINDKIYRIAVLPTHFFLGDFVSPPLCPVSHGVYIAIVMHALYTLSKSCDKRINLLASYSLMGMWHRIYFYIIK